MTQYDPLLPQTSDAFFSSTISIPPYLLPQLFVHQLLSPNYNIVTLSPTPRHPHLGQPRHPHPRLLLQQYRFLLPLLVFVVPFCPTVVTFYTTLDNLVTLQYQLLIPPFLLLSSSLLPLLQQSTLLPSTTSYLPTTTTTSTSTPRQLPVPLILLPRLQLLSAPAQTFSDPSSVTIEDRKRRRKKLVST